MRIPLFACLLALVIAPLPGCGDGDAKDPWTFQSKAKEPTGEVIKITYDLQEGQGVRMEMKTTGTMTMDMGQGEQDQPMDMTMATSMRCTKVAPDGSRTLEVVIDTVDMGAAGAAMPMTLEGVRGTMTIDAEGKVTSMDLEADDPQLDQIFKKMFQGGGFATAFPWPKQGMRVGEAIDMADIVPMEQLKGAMAGLPGLENLEPEIQGEYVLVGTTTVEGEQAAEFAITMIMTMAMDMGEKGSMSSKARSSGTQFISLRTGLPVGTSTLTQVMDMEMDMTAGGQSQQMTMRGTSTAEMTATPLK